MRDAKHVLENYMVKLTDAQVVNVESLTHLDNRRQGEFIVDPVEDELREVS